MTARLMPYVGSRPYLVLQALLAGPGTFYQICERAGLDIEEPGMEPCMRKHFAGLLLAHIELNNITYTIKTSTRQALQAKPAACVCSVATAHHRGPSEPQPVTVVRRPSRSDTGEVA
ncbi:hypothetical protein [Janthinobacterium sp. RA13]|uniref:hypothetical protein n=1 Tax=Janthinobacterium sp. RA13 TaxID=1502762 RepID=UPI00055A2C90|nr:hypothetical protein [Janthinobacterium sp. RA13]